MSGSVEVDKSAEPFQPEDELAGFRPAEELLKAANSQSRYVLVPPRVFQLARTLFLLGGCSASIGAASLGTCLLAYLLFFTSVAPSHDRFSQELFLDYSKSEAVATASFLPGPLPSTNALPKVSAASARLLVPGTQVDVILELELPDDDATNGDVFQVTGKLISGDGREAAVVSRPCVLQYRSPAVRKVRTLVVSPLVLLGLWKERQTVRLELFTSYTDKVDPAFVFFKALLKARAGSGSVPRVYKAVVRVSLRLGWLGRLLFMGRPGPWGALLLGALGLSALGGGCVALMGIIGLWLLSGPASQTRPSKRAKPAEDVSDESDRSDVDFDSGVLREPDSDPELEEGQEGNADAFQHPASKQASALDQTQHDDIQAQDPGLRDSHSHSLNQSHAELGPTVVPGIPVGDLQPRHRSGWEAQTG